MGVVEVLFICLSIVAMLVTLLTFVFDGDYDGKGVKNRNWHYLGSNAIVQAPVAFLYVAITGITSGINPSTLLWMLGSVFVGWLFLFFFYGGPTTLTPKSVENSVVKTTQYHKSRLANRTPVANVQDNDALKAQGFAPLGTGKDEDRQRAKMLLDWWEQDFEREVGADQVRAEFNKISRSYTTELAAINNTIEQTRANMSHSRNYEDREKRIARVNDLHEKATKTKRYYESRGNETLAEYNARMLRKKDLPLPQFEYKRPLF